MQKLVSLHQELILVSLVEPGIQEDSFVVDLIPRKLPKLANYVPNLWTFCNTRYEAELIIDRQHVWVSLQETHIEAKLLFTRPIEAKAIVPSSDLDKKHFASVVCHLPLACPVLNEMISSDYFHGCE